MNNFVVHYTESKLICTVCDMAFNRKRHMFRNLYLIYYVDGNGSSSHFYVLSQVVSSYLVRLRSLFDVSWTVRLGIFRQIFIYSTVIRLVFLS